MKKKRDQRSRPPGSESGVKGRGAGRRYAFGYKLKAVKLYLEEGYNQSLISEELGCSSASVMRWAQAYRALVAGIEYLGPEEDWIKALYVNLNTLTQKNVRKLMIQNGINMPDSLGDALVFLKSSKSR